MPRTITVSLPVSNLEASKAFYTALGFESNPRCSGDGTAFMVWSETISIMLLTHEKWRTFTTRPIPPNTSSEVGLNISCESREQVDAMNRAAAEHGGNAAPQIANLCVGGREPYGIEQGVFFGAELENLPAER